MKITKFEHIFFFIPLNVYMCACVCVQRTAVFSLIFFTRILNYLLLKNDTIKMSSKIANPLKNALRTRMKKQILPAMTAESKQRQSKAIAQQVLRSEAFRSAQRISIYLSTGVEVDTTALLHEMFRLEKQIFVPTYNGASMEMVRLKDMQDYETLPLTKWKIKQPNIKDGRENALTNGHGIDLFLMPGVAFTKCGARMGHGMGYYDSYLKRHFSTYPHKKVTLMALAFTEQIVEEHALPMEAHDIRLHSIITEK